MPPRTRQQKTASTASNTALPPREDFTPLEDLGKDDMDTRGGRESPQQAQMPSPRSDKSIQDLTALVAQLSASMTAMEQRFDEQTCQFEELLATLNQSFHDLQNANRHRHNIKPLTIPPPAHPLTDKDTIIDRELQKLRRKIKD